MTACYGLPDYLIDPAAYAVNVAWRAATSTGPDWSEEFDGRPLHTLKALWSIRVSDQVHAGLLSPADARELLRVVEDGIEINAAWLKNINLACFEDAFPCALELDLRSEELLVTLRDIATIEERLVA